MPTMYHCINLFVSDDIVFKQMLVGVFKHIIENPGTMHHIIVNDLLNGDELTKRRLDCLFAHSKMVYDFHQGKEWIYIGNPLHYIVNNNQPYDKTYLYFIAQYLTNYHIYKQKSGPVEYHFYIHPTELTEFSTLKLTNLPKEVSLNLFVFNASLSEFYSISNHISSITATGTVDAKYVQPFISNNAIATTTTSQSMARLNELAHVIELFEDPLLANDAIDALLNLQQVNTTTQKKRKTDNEYHQKTSKIKTRASTTSLPVTHDPRHISIHDAALSQKLLDERGIHYQQDKFSHSIKNDLVIGHVAILSSNSHTKSLGVFARKRIPTNRTLGTYFGKIIHSANDSDRSYNFNLTDNGETFIDASKQCNWTAFVNSAGSEDLANVESCADGDEIFYKTCREINEGEQLLIFYGSQYHFDNQYRFLKPSDGSKESIEIMNERPDVYAREAKPLFEQQASALRVSPNAWFKIPQKTLDSDEDYWKLPLLECEPYSSTPLPQHQQENVTLLMYACLSNDMALLDQLLTDGADINTQSSKSGYTALHVLVRSSLNVDDKINLIRKLFDNDAAFYLQDWNNQSILHAAIESNDADILIPFLLETLVAPLKSHQKTKYYRTAFSCINNSDLDPFLYSISLGKIDLSLVLARYVAKEDIKNYLSAEGGDVFREQIKTISDINKRMVILDKFCLVYKDSYSKENRDIIKKLKAIFQSTDNTKSTHSKHNMFSHDSFDNIINNTEIAINVTINRLEQHFSSKRFNTLALKTQRSRLHQAITWCINNAAWFIDSYQLYQLQPGQLPERDDKHLYIMPDHDNAHIFEYQCVDLNGNTIKGTIQLAPNKTPTPDNVIEAISLDGHDISNAARIQRATVCLQKVDKYLNCLIKKGGGLSAEQQNTLNNLTKKINVTCDRKTRAKQY